MRVPRAEGDGWLVGAFLDYARGLTAIAVFDAGHAVDGQVARAWLDNPLPIAFHGSSTAAWAQCGTCPVRMTDRAVA